MLIGAQAVGEAVAAGCVFARSGAWAGGFLGVLAVGVDLGLCGGAAVCLFLFFILILRALCAPYLSLGCYRERLAGAGGRFSHVIENRGSERMPSVVTGRLSRLRAGLPALQGFRRCHGTNGATPALKGIRRNGKPATV